MFQARGFERNPYWGAMSRNRQFACLNGPPIVQNVVRNLPAKSLKNDFLGSPHGHHMVTRWPSTRVCIFFDQFWMTSTMLGRDFGSRFLDQDPSLEPNSVSKLAMEDSQWKTPNERLPMEDFQWNTPNEKSPMEDSQRKTPKGRLPMKDSQWKTPNGTLPIEDSQWKTPNGTLPMENSQWKNPNGRFPIEDSQWKTPNVRFPKEDSQRKTPKERAPKEDPQIET